VRLVAAADCAAEALRDRLQAGRLTGGAGRERYYTSGSGGQFTGKAALLLGRSIEGLVEEIPVMEVED
ncbi:MAG: hypothetical protein IJ594_06495, partial [Oscillospiraceae bacterium]|nr:hypothetical protein [Oscillospiraceae bacterium]